MDMENFGRVDRVSLHAHGILPRWMNFCRALIAAFFPVPKFILLLALAGCGAIPFGVPQEKPGYPIVTSGYFSLPDGARLPYRLYPAQGRVRAVVLALHGYTDSRDGWAMLAGTLNPQGIAIYAPDQSSFGATRNRGHWPGTQVLVDEARDMAVQLRAQYPGVKLYLMGESMGGGVGLLLGTQPNPPPVDGYILSAPAVWGGAAMNPGYRAVLWATNAVAPGHRLTTRHVHVKASDNEAALVAFGQDPLTIHAPRVDQLAGVVDLMGQAQAACADFRQKALILYGGHDQIIPAAPMRRCWRAVPADAPVILAYYPPDYHLLPRDLERAVPSADILAFIEGRGLPSAAPSQATVFLADQ
jgi:alpha-beta hydrolase superfamily lysophospholipase